MSSVNKNTTGDDSAPLNGPFTALLALVKKRSSATEKASKFDGAFSYADEWHAAALGFAAGFSGDPATAQKVTSYALGLGGGKSALSDDPHIRDMADEPAYALGALSAGRALRNGELLQAIPL